MKIVRNQNNELSADGDRITKFGNFLRITSLDELPEFFNVLKGEMSIVGPRPLLMQYLGRYSDEQSRRHDVLPGITGWAQINGRNAISWEEKFRLDVWYVDNWTFWLDFRIILLTIWKVIKGEGISQPGRATMDEFMGNAEK
jgi:lipopolysaccharide/colanic/teichoic acid biosynthesis glycosyltransferase